MYQKSNAHLSKSDKAELVSAVFVHAQSRRQYAAPHKRNARQFKKALHRPILSILTMKDGKGSVQTNLLHSPCPNTRRADSLRFGNTTAGVQISGSNQVSFSVHILKHSGCGLEGHAILRGTAAKQNNDFQSFHCSACLSAKYSSRHSPFSYISVAASTPTYR